jgi:hypothetical protein
MVAKKRKGRAAARPILHKTETLGRGLDYRDNLAATFGAELHCSGCESEQRVIVTATNVVTGVEVSAALTNQDFASLNNLTAKPLNA